MYLEDGREIYESDRYPGYYIDADTGAFCDENGNYIGGNIDNGDMPGSFYCSSDNIKIVWVTKAGKQYYPNKTKTATIPISLSTAKREHYKPSKGYLTFINKELHKKQRKTRKK